MKKIAYLTICLSSWFGTVATQTNFEEGKKKYFEYDDKTKKIISDNWCMYFGKNVIGSLNKELAKNIFEIKMDSYGNLYPHEEILAAIDKDQFHGKLENYASMNSHSFHRLFQEASGTKLDTVIRALKDEKQREVYLQLLSDSKTIATRDRFDQRWDKYHNEKLVDDLKAKIAKMKISRLIFFIHGFNVPYSLAAIQTLAMFKLARDSAGVDDKSLFVPVYWPSNNAKFCDLSPDEFNIKNISEYERNGKLFLYYTNRCYYAAISLRKIISSLDENLKIDIVAHSLGATIATSCFINTTSKFQYGKFDRLKNHHSAKDCTWLFKKDERWLTDDLTFDLLRNFYSTPVPKKKVNIFLSAAAIPGISTFTDAVESNLEKIQFFVTVNQYDEMVSKDNIRKTLKGLTGVNLKFISPSRLSSTTLGCNYRCEAYATEKYYNEKIEENQFHVATVSEETDHDIFTYLQQKRYRDFYEEFLKAK